MKDVTLCDSCIKAARITGLLSGLSRMGISVIIGLILVSIANMLEDPGFLVVLIFFCVVGFFYGFRGMCKAFFYRKEQLGDALAGNWVLKQRVTTWQDGSFITRAKNKTLTNRWPS